MGGVAYLIICMVWKVPYHDEDRSVAFEGKAVDTNNTLHGAVVIDCDGRVVGTECAPPRENGGNRGERVGHQRRDEIQCLIDRFYTMGYSRDVLFERYPFINHILGIEHNNNNRFR